MVTREICKICYQVNRVGFSVPDETWKAVVPESHQSGVVCLECFTRLGDEKMIHWDKNIEFWPVSLASHLEGEIDIKAAKKTPRIKGAMRIYPDMRGGGGVIPDQPSPTRRSTT